MLTKVFSYDWNGDNIEGKNKMKLELKKFSPNLGRKKIILLRCHIVWLYFFIFTSSLHVSIQIRK